MTELLATALLGSLLGSLHCVGMCGPFVAFYAEGAQRPSEYGLPHVLYNLGRLLAYMGLGAAMGLMGAALDRAGLWSGFQNVAAFGAALFMVVYGGALTYRALRPAASAVHIGPPSRWSRMVSRVLGWSRRLPARRRALFVGLGTGLLPCGWLYGFAALAGGTASPWQGALVMAAFWLGTVPAMFGAGLGFESAARWLGPKLPMLMPALVLALGLVSLTHRSLAAVRGGSEGSPTCHHEPR